MKVAGIVLLVPLLVAGCGGAPRNVVRAGAGRDHVPPDPGASGGKRAQISYRNDLDYDNMYARDVDVSGAVDPRRVLDQIIAILRQGPQDASVVDVSVYPPGKKPFPWTRCRWD